MPEIKLPGTPEGYSVPHYNAKELERVNRAYGVQVAEFLKTATYLQAAKVYKNLLLDPNLHVAVMAEIGLRDRFFLLGVILKVNSILKEPWLYERCREVEANTDGYLDLWSREHWKSSIITYGGSIQELAKNNNITIGIFSHTKKIASSFLSRIKYTCETNELLPHLWPKTFWMNPERQAPSWSIDSGLVMKRTVPSNMASVEAWGLVDSMPTSKHFDLMIYDDVVSPESVGTADQIAKTTTAWELSRNLSARNTETGKRRTWYVGTRYHYADTYRTMIDRGVAKTRIYPATDNGQPDGKPVFFTQEDWDERVRESSPSVIACQMLLNPLAGTEQKFKPEWIQRWEVRPKTLNVYIMCDPAGNSKKDHNCNTAIAVIGVDGNLNKYLLDGYLHKMGLVERWTALKTLRQKWIKEPGIQIVKVGYERFGMQCDLEHFSECMQREKYPFEIIELAWPNDGKKSKEARIDRLIPDHQNWRFFYPYDGKETSNQTKAREQGQDYLISKPIKRKNHEGRMYDLVQWFITNEYTFYPATTHLDMFDSMSRIYDMEITAPAVISERDVLPEYYDF